MSRQPLPRRATASCALPLQNARVTSAQIVAAGAFTPPAPATVPAAKAAPRDAAGRARRWRCAWRWTRRQSAESLSHAARVLPGRGDADAVERLGHQGRSVDARRPSWNGKFQAVGNGGWAGTIAYPAMATALRRRLRDGEHRHRPHRRRPRQFALGHPEKVIDYRLSRRCTR